MISTACFRRINIRSVLDYGTAALLMPFTIVFIVLFSLLSRMRGKRKVVVFAGLEHVIQKTNERGCYFLGKGFDVYYYSFENTDSGSLEDCRSSIVRAKRWIVADIISFQCLCMRIRPIYVEMYFEQVGLNQLFYIIIARLMNILTISILRGELYNWDTRNEPVRKFFRIAGWRLSDAIFYRELYMAPYFERLEIQLNRTCFDPNKVAVREEPSYHRDEKVVLFLNGFKKWRRVNLLVDAIPEILEKHPTTKIHIVGARNQNEYNEVLALTDLYIEAGVVQLHFWVNDSRMYFEQASVFVLPADLVFCNFSLLEAMERGVPPIVADVHDADKIVAHGINGFLCKQNAPDIAKHVNILLSDENLRREMGKQARKTVEEKFNSKTRMTPIWDLIINRYSNMFN